uniref:UPAR/Ly6 domain-containing protein n=1 Tax=Panagrellus redivivus TaxID=6233 RepID=A0A7E4ULV5_PANRE
MAVVMYVLLLAAVLPVFCMAISCNTGSNGEEPCFGATYCAYIKTREIASDVSSTRRACLFSNPPEITYDRSSPPFTTINTCSQLTVSGIEYTMKICDTDYCNFLCDYYPVPPVPTTTHGAAATTSLAVLPVILLAALM